MRKQAKALFRPGVPELEAPVRSSAAGQAVLDCVLLALLLGGLVHALCGAYRLQAPAWPVCAIAVAAAAGVRLCLLSKKAGIPAGLGICLLWVVFLLRRLEWICLGAVHLANDAAGAMAAKSGGTFPFAPWAVAGDGAACEKAFLAAALPALGALLALCVWQRRTVLTALLAFAWLVPALHFTILPPMAGMAAMMAAVAALSTLHAAGGRCAVAGAGAPLRRGLTALPTALVCAGLILSALPPASYVRSPQLEQARRVMEEMLDSLAPGRIRGGLANTTGRVDMRRAAGVSFSGKTVLRVQGMENQPLYLKSFVGGSYADSVWTAPDARVYRAFAASRDGQAGSVPNPQLLPARYADLVDAAHRQDGYFLEEERRKTLSVKNLAANPRCAYIPYGLTGLPEGASFDGDERAKFDNPLGKTRYQVPFTLYRAAANGVAGSFLSETDQVTAQWPLLSPGDAISGIFFSSQAGADSLQPLYGAFEESIGPDGSVDMAAYRRFCLYGWERAGLTETQRRGMRLVSAVNYQQLLQEQGAQLPAQELPANYRRLYTEPLAPVQERGGVPEPAGTPLDLGEYGADAGAYWAYEAAYRRAVYDTYTQVPEGLRERLTDWLRERGLGQGSFAGPAGQAYSRNAAQEIADCLADACRYSLHPGAPPQGTDFIDHFLNANHLGYCVHFATAETLLLRTLGIPARYAEGYYLPSGYGAQDHAWIDVPDSRAHAWVEIYSPGLGWVPFEATPGFSAAAAPDNTAAGAGSSQPEESAAPSETAVSSAQPASSAPVSSAAADVPVPAAGGGQPAGIWAGAAAVSGTAGLAVLLVALRHLCTVRRRWRRFHQRDRNAAGVAVYAYLLRLRRYGGSVPEQAVSCGEKARFSQHTLTQEECDTLRGCAAAAARALLSRQPNALARFALRYLYNVIYLE